jgi:Flp pilus assembly protein TadB
VSRTSPKKTILIGLACGVAAVVLVRVGMIVLLGGVKALAILTAIGVVWLISRRPRSRRSGR